MPNGTVKLIIPFDILADAVSELGLEDKQRLWSLLYEQIEQAEEDLFEQDPETRAEIEEARTAFEAGDYVTFEEL